MLIQGKQRTRNQPPPGGTGEREEDATSSGLATPLTALRGRENSVLPLWLLHHHGTSSRMGRRQRPVPADLHGRAPRRRDSKLGDEGRGAAEGHVAPKGSAQSWQEVTPMAGDPEGFRVDGG